MSEMKLKINFLLVLCAIYCPHYNLAIPISGPNVHSAAENEFPFVVSIAQLINIGGQNQWVHVCTGTLISRQDVLTAEHCLSDAITAAIKVLVGSVDLTRSTDYFPLFCLTYDHWVIYRHIQPEYDRNDMAFVKLLRDVPETLQRALIGNAPNDALYGLHLQIAGWGILENNTAPMILQTDTVTVITNDQCERRISDFGGSWYFLGDRRLCTIGNPYAILNNGDSGGPLIYFGSLIAVNVGVYPFTTNVFNPRQLNIHMCLRFYYNFISDVTTTFHMNY